MQAFILVGSVSKQTSYLDSFCLERKIKSFNRHDFLQFKILDARNLIKLLSKKLPTDEKQIIVISEPTLDAENAILKTIEEIPESTYVFFLCEKRDSFLPTIQSRTLTIHVGEEQVLSNVTLRKRLEDLISQKDTACALSLCAEEHSLDTIISELRLMILESTGDTEKMRILYAVIKEILKTAPLIKNNNVQEKFFLETVFLSRLKST